MDRRFGAAARRVRVRTCAVGWWLGGEIGGGRARFSFVFPLEEASRRAPGGDACESGDPIPSWPGVYAPRAAGPWVRADGARALSSRGDKSHEGRGLARARRSRRRCRHGPVGRAPPASLRAGSGHAAPSGLCSAAGSFDRQRSSARTAWCDRVVCTPHSYFSGIGGRGRSRSRSLPTTKRVIVHVLPRRIRRLL